jgi:hypothetical protein
MPKTSTSTRQNKVVDLGPTKVKKTPISHNRAQDLFRECILFCKTFSMVRYNQWSSFFKKICDLQFSDFKLHTPTSTNYYRYYTSVFYGNVDITALPTNIRWLSNARYGESNEIWYTGYFTRNNVDLIQCTVYSGQNETDQPCSCFYNDMFYCAERHASGLGCGRFEYIIFNILEIVPTNDELCTILDQQPHFVYVLLDIFEYDRTIELVQMYASNRGFSIFNPLQFRSFSECIVCASNSLSWVCSNQYCTLYFTDYQNSVPHLEAKSMLGEFILPTLSNIVYQYLFPFHQQKPHKLSKYSTNGLKIDLAYFWNYLFRKL